MKGTGACRAAGPRLFVLSMDIPAARPGMYTVDTEVDPSMSIPTYEDARLLLELYRIRYSPEFQEAHRWFMTDFEAGSWEEVRRTCPPASREAGYLGQVMAYYSALGTMVFHNLLSEDILFDVIEDLMPVWQRVQPWIYEAREAEGPHLYENVELLVERQQRWKRLYRSKLEALG